MIKLIVGNKGSGKTKKMIELINESVRTSDGSIVCVEKGMKLTYEVNHQVRLVNIDKYSIDSFEMFQGFVSGFLASNYDISDIYIDGILKIGGRDLNSFADMLDKLDVLTKEANADITFTVSADKHELPEKIRKFVL